MMQRKICVITGTRAEYGLLYWLIKDIDADPELELQLIVTSMHLSPEFGLTYRQIEQDGFHISDKVEMLLSADTPSAISKSIGLGVIGFSDSFRRLTPDLVVLLGDRYEIFAAAQAALVAGVPMAHIHGGETTEGAIDEAFRHAITKMSHFHFVTAEPYRKRVIQLGEDPEKVYNVGAPGLDYAQKMKFLTRDELEKALHVKFATMNFLVTYHPTTIGGESAEVVMRQLLSALDHFSDALVIFTYPNSDTFGRVIISLISDYVQKNSKRCLAKVTLGQKNYLSMLREVDVVIGNSSSGIIEAPYFKKPTVNIGTRQTGRLKAKSVIDCGNGESEIIRAIKRAISPEFRASLPEVQSVYGYGDTSAQIMGVLKQASLENIVLKKFHDLS